MELLHIWRLLIISLANTHTKCSHNESILFKINKNGLIFRSHLIHFYLAPGLLTFVA